jgi:hypothetical protein
MEGESSATKGGVSLMAEQLVIQLDGGGSTPTTPLQIPLKRCVLRVVEWSTIAPLLREFHYRKDSIGGSIRYCFGLYFDGWLIGGAAVGDPRHAEAYGGTRFEITELRRLCCHQLAPKNTESYFIGKILWWLGKYTPYKSVLSYADTSVGHVGTIYKATNFQYLGQTDPTQFVRINGRDYHMRSLTIDRPYAKELKEKVNSGEAEIVTGGEKNIYLYQLQESRN